MPKSLFYLGVAFSIAAALLLAMAVVERGLSGDWFDLTNVNLLRGSTISGVVAVMLFSIPIAGIFLRMASLVAARNLFASFFAIFATGSAAISAGLYSALDFRGAVIVGRLTPMQAETLEMILELRLATLYALGFFLATMFLSTRPYFKLQTRSIAALVALPLPLFFLILFTRFTAPLGESILATAATATLLLLFAFLFAVIAIHGLRHRHLFIEVTNLRELLDARIDPSASAPPREGFGFSRGAPITEN